MSPSHCLWRCFESGCWWRDWALQQLDRRGRDYRIAYSSASVAGIQAAVSSGLAVGVLAASTRPPATRVLTEAEGFHPLPGSHVILRRSSERETPAVTCMAEAISKSLRTEGASIERLQSGH